MRKLHTRLQLETLELRHGISVEANGGSTQQRGTLPDVKALLTVPVSLSVIRRASVFFSAMVEDLSAETNTQLRDCFARYSVLIQEVEGRLLDENHTVELITF
eukprot:Protomagalhaensia_wolfi_Nauph_80__5974@NODE_803_length_1986_cov_100_647663_g602_i0_p4_GENE_NODE_803_length_1986_cov_100_647663_g602_i0NODE_803_length_1986_cov_100_647663_g602_i0_p4_ORF_typecomplete_len103_score17_14_NODE_803_length_1986_cov_100_647663_g602_i013211629